MKQLILLLIKAINAMLAADPADTATIAANKRDVQDYMDRNPEIDPDLETQIMAMLNSVGAATAPDPALVDTVAAVEPVVLTTDERNEKTIRQATTEGIPPVNTREYLKAIQTAPEDEAARNARLEKESKEKGREVKGEEDDDSLVDEKGERKHKKDKDHKKEDHDKDKNQHKEHKGKLPPLQPDDSGLDEPAPQPK